MSSIRIFDFQAFKFSYIFLFSNKLSEYGRLYQTGDFVSIIKGGAVQYEGRTDSQIKIRGHRVDLMEIDKNLLELNGIEKEMVLCYHPGEIDQTLLAFVTLTKDSVHQHGLQIENALNNKLADYMVPQVVIVDAIPLLVNGKIDRQALLKMYENTNNNGMIMGACAIAFIETLLLIF